MSSGERWNPPWARPPEAARYAPREVTHEFHVPTQAVTLRSALVVVFCFVAILVGVFVIFT
jgi:hypothetical protein